MIKVIKYLVFLFLIFCVIFVLNFVSGINKAVSEKSEIVSFVVSSGFGVEKIGDNLVALELVSSKLYFKVYVKLNGFEKDFKAGRYELDKNLNIKEITKILTEGETINNEKEIKIIEGWTIYDIADYFEDEGMFEAKEVMDFVGVPKIDYRVNKRFVKLGNFSEKFDFLIDKPDYYSFEGYIFPDTYKIYKDASLEDVIFKTFSNLGRKLTAEMREDIKKQGKSIFEIITMASIIQKEVRSENDMKMVSGIFWNRMSDNHPLQSCASLAYILELNKKVYSIADTKIDSPYNTYQNAGLPPGPISNPGIEAIKAAIYPTENDYYFFLSKSGTGETVFSKTLREHNINKAKYLK